MKEKKKNTATLWINWVGHSWELKSLSTLVKNLHISKPTHMSQHGNYKMMVSLSPHSFAGVTSFICVEALRNPSCPSRLILTISSYYVTNCRLYLFSWLVWQLTPSGNLQGGQKMEPLFIYASLQKGIKCFVPFNKEKGTGKTVVM